MFAIAYAASAASLVFVALYYLLASIPFSYYHFLQFPHFWWQPLFIAAHPALFGAALFGVIPRGASLPPRIRRLSRYLALAGGAAALCLLAIELFPPALSYELAAALTFVPLLLLIAAGALQIAAHPESRLGGQTPRSSWRPTVGGALAGALVGAAYVAASAERGAAAALGTAEFTMAASLSLAAHVVSFAAVAFAVALIRNGVHGRVRLAIAPLGVALAATVGSAVLIRRSLLTALMLGDLRAAAVSLAVAAGIVASAWAIAARRKGFAPGGSSRWIAAVLSGAALALLIFILPQSLVLADWGGSLQKTAAMAAWVAGAVMVGSLSINGRRIRFAAASLAVAIVAASTAIAAAWSRDGSRVGRTEPRVELGVAAERYATFDASFGVLLDVLRPVVSDTEFYRTVRDAGEVTADRTLPPVRLALADPLPRPAGRPPNIFVVVVDSLRPDYISPYNPDVTFTPAIGAFGADSVVMRRAFTQYAGTALSQPALWAGALIQRAMYIRPFSAVDNLERLVVAAGYRRYVSVDEILGIILGDWSEVRRLDSHLAHPERRDQMFKFDLCATVDELARQLDTDDGTRPLFFYSQPQTLHIRVLAGDSSPRDERVTVGGAQLFGPAVRALTRVDACFGRLVADLKARGLYDDSIIVLTSDHGDSYGEAGRWGHAFYMAPETLRIPLIVHVPPKLMQGRTFDAAAPAMLTDVTPTLYDLLGYPPTGTDLAGRSLFHRPSDARERRDRFFVQSSYSSVFGLLDGDARWLYVADANHNREELYDLTTTIPYGQPVAPPERPKYRKWLLDNMMRVNRFYAPSARR